MTRAEEIGAEVYARTHVFDAFDQGRWGHAIGTPRDRNPHGPIYPGYFHVNMTEWLRGWDTEARGDGR